MKWYAVRCRETGSVIECCFAQETAEKVVAMYEKSDYWEDMFEPDFYEIVETDGAPEVPDRDEYDYDVLDITRAYLGIDY